MRNDEGVTPAVYALGEIQGSKWEVDLERQDWCVLH